MTTSLPVIITESDAGITLSWYPCSSSGRIDKHLYCVFEFESVIAVRSFNSPFQPLYGWVHGVRYPTEQKQIEEIKVSGTFQYK